MAYDMYWHRRPAADSPEMQDWANAQKAVEAYYREIGRDRTDEQRARMEELLVESARLEHWYFCLNIWGMGEARTQLLRYGVVNASYDQMPEFPKLADFGLQKWPEDESSPAASELLRASDEHLSWTPPGDHHGVAIHKLGSNDGWHVTPGEILTGVGWADAHHNGWRHIIDDYVGGFVEWMERAAAVGEGFRVN